MLLPKMVNYYYPVIGVTYHNGVIEVERANTRGKPKTSGRKARPIRFLSAKSLGNLAFTVLASQVKFLSLMTLTYPCTFPLDGRAVKRDLNKFLTYARRKFGSFEYVWFLEFQKRGAPHLHILTTLPDPTFHQRAVFSNIWAHVSTQDGPERNKVRFVHGRKQAWEGIRKEDGAKRYALKYAMKTEQKVVPQRYSNVGRFWAASKAVRPPKKEPARCARALWSTVTPPFLGNSRQRNMGEDKLRTLLGHLGHPAAEWDVLPKYIYLAQEKTK